MLEYGEFWGRILTAKGFPPIDLEEKSSLSISTI